MWVAGGIATRWRSDHQLLIAHMAQHLLLMTVAAPLILVGLPALAAPANRCGI